MAAGVDMAEVYPSRAFYENGPVYHGFLKAENPQRELREWANVAKKLGKIRLHLHCTQAQVLAPLAFQIGKSVNLL